MNSNTFALENIPQTWESDQDNLWRKKRIPWKNEKLLSLI
jgi:hypothetical protein